MNADSSGSLPCRRQQACDMRRRLYANEDELAAIVEQSKLCKENGEEEIVHCVSLAPEPCIILTTDAQMKELERCHQHSVLSVAPTFELGNFYGTPIGFLHPLFKNRDSNTHPLFIGPMLIHKRLQFSTYHYFALQLISLIPNLKSVRAFGTDGERTLYDAFSAVFPNAVNL